ncbi:MAG: hypothetical protein WB676_25890 [Bryobacteraceae bacterium]
MQTVSKEAARDYRETAKFIPHERIKAEELEWGNWVDPNEHCPYSHYEIADGTGTVYTGVEYGDGSIETAGSCLWESAETFRADFGRPLWKTYLGFSDTETLYWNEDTGEWYCYREHRNGENFSCRVKEGELLEWLPSLVNHDMLELCRSGEDGYPEVGNVFVSLPGALVQKARDLTSRGQSARDWIVETLLKAVETAQSKPSPEVRSLSKR